MRWIKGDPETFYTTKIDLAIRPSTAYSALSGLSFQGLSGSVPAHRATTPQFPGRLSETRPPPRFARNSEWRMLANLNVCENRSRYKSLHGILQLPTDMQMLSQNLAILPEASPDDVCDSTRTVPPYLTPTPRNMVASIGTYLRGRGRMEGS